MGLVRLFLLLAVGWFIWRLLMRAAVSSTSPAPPRSTADGQKNDYLPLTRCAICGAHIPQPQNAAAPICERCRTR